MTKPSVEIGKMVVAQSDGMWLAYFMETGQSMAEATLLATIQIGLVNEPDLQDSFFQLIRICVARYVQRRWGAPARYGPAEDAVMPDDDELPMPPFPPPVRPVH